MTQLLECVKMVVKGEELSYWLPVTINSICNRINFFSDSEIADFELVYFELSYWLKNEIGHVFLKDTIAKLEKSLHYIGRAKRIKAHIEIGAGYPHGKDNIWIKSR